MQTDPSTVLTIEAMDATLPGADGDAIARRDWRPVLTLPFPKYPSVALLKRATKELLDFLAWATDPRYACDVQSRYPRPAHVYWITDGEAEIHRAAKRLIDINAKMTSARLRDFMLELRRQRDEKHAASDAARNHAI